MKKTLALILAIVMMAALAVPAFAETTPPNAGVTTQEANNSTGNDCKVTYGVAQTYTISLPTAINFAVDTDLSAPNTQTCVISVSKLVISGGKKLVVTMDSANEGGDGNVNGWNMIATNCDPVTYTVKTSNPDPENGTHVDTITNDATVPNAKVAGEVKASTILGVNSNAQGKGGSVVLTFSTKGTSQAGDYEDTITFGVSIA